LVAREDGLGHEADEHRLLGGVAAGLWMDVPEAVDSCVRVVRTVEPREDWVSRYAALRPCYDALYPGLHGIQHAAD